MLVVCVPVEGDGSVDPRWGRANRVATAEVGAEGVAVWREFDVQWGDLHEEGSERRHHARIAKFLRDHGVQMVVADHMGAGMLQMLETMKIAVHLGASGDGRQAVLDAVSRNTGAS